MLQPWRHCCRASISFIVGAGHFLPWPETVSVNRKMKCPRLESGKGLIHQYEADPAGFCCCLIGYDYVTYTGPTFTILLPLKHSNFRHASPMSDLVPALMGQSLGRTVLLQKLALSFSLPVSQVLKQVFSGSWQFPICPFLFFEAALAIHLVSRVHSFLLQFGWTHVTLLIVVTQSHLVIHNLFEGMIW